MNTHARDVHALARERMYILQNRTHAKDPLHVERPDCCAGGITSLYSCIAKSLYLMITSILYMPGDLQEWIEDAQAATEDVDDPDMKREKMRQAGLEPDPDPHVEERKDQFHDDQVEVTPDDIPWTVPEGHEHNLRQSRAALEIAGKTDENMFRDPERVLEEERMEPNETELPRPTPRDQAITVSRSDIPWEVSPKMNLREIRANMEQGDTWETDNMFEHPERVLHYEIQKRKDNPMPEVEHTPRTDCGAGGLSDKEGLQFLMDNAHRVEDGRRRALQFLIVPRLRGSDVDTYVWCKMWVEMTGATWSEKYVDAIESCGIREPHSISSFRDRVPEFIR